MANRRMINSDLFSDDVFMELDDLTRLVWIGLIVMSADDQGRLQDNELLIKSQIFPMDNKSSAKIKSSLDTLEHHDMIRRYQKGDKNLIQIVNWWKHQSPSWASASAYPAPDNWIDREKYHAVGNKVVTTNWDTSGGFSNLHSTLHSQLPTGVSRLIDESEYTIKSENTIKSESDGKSETPEGGTVTSSQSQKILSITDHIQKAGTQVKPDDEQAIKQLVAVFKTPDIHDAIDHMAAHTNRPNIGYLKKVLDGWYSERKIQKVYSV
jgi:hypothetical protein